jgi:hypothetical protein
VAQLDSPLTLCSALLRSATLDSQRIPLQNPAEKTCELKKPEIDLLKNMAQKSFYTISKQQFY